MGKFTSLRVLLIRKEFKQLYAIYSYVNSLRVLLIRKEFKLWDTDTDGTTCLRVLLIRKEFKRSDNMIAISKGLRVLLIRKEFKLPIPKNAATLCLRVLLIRKEFKPLIKVCIYFLCECHSTRVSHNLFDNRLINTSSRQHRYTCMSAAMWCTINIKLFHKWLEIAIIVVSVLKMLSVFCVK